MAAAGAESLLNRIDDEQIIAVAQRGRDGGNSTVKPREREFHLCANLTSVCPSIQHNGPNTTLSQVEILSHLEVETQAKT